MAGRLIHTGQAIVDLLMTVPHLPERGGDVLSSSSEFLPGGGFNVMAAAARSGCEVRYAGAHGTGPMADRLRAAMRVEGVSAIQPQQADVDNGVCVVLVEPDGERTFVTGVGAEGRLDEGQLAAVRPEPADLVYVTGYSLLHASNQRSLLNWLPGVGAARVLFDPGPLIGEIPAHVLERVLPLVDVLSVNAAEAEELGELPDAVTLVVRNGPEGCTVRQGAKPEQHVPGFPVTPVDTTGAGDAHCGVLAAGLLAGLDIVEAARRANAAAALSVRLPGGCTAPDRAAIDDFLGE